MRESPASQRLDELYGKLLGGGRDADSLKSFLAGNDVEGITLLALLRRPVPVQLLEHLASVPPWSEDRRLAGAIVLSPRSPRGLALRLLGSLFWRDLADVASSPRLDMAVRIRAEGLLKEMLPDLRLGERVTLAKLATRAVVPSLLADESPRVVGAALLNPRLTEDNLLISIRAQTVSRELLEETAASKRWQQSYNVRLELVLQPRAPLAVALGQLSGLLPRDLQRIATAKGLPGVVQAAALRVVKERGKP